MKHLGLSILALSVCLLVSNIAQADTMWWIGSGDFTAGPWKELSWSGGAHWVYGSYTPGPNDEARFYGDEIEGGSTTINVAGDVTVGSMTLSGYAAYTFTGASTINAGTFTYATRAWGTGSPLSTMSDRLDLTGQFVATSDQYEWWGAYPPGLTDTSIFSLTSSGNVFGGGFNVTYNSIHIDGNNNVINGPITVEGHNCNDYTDSGYGFGQGTLKFSGAGNVFGAVPINLNPYGTLNLAASQDLGNVTTINFNGGTLELTAGNTFGALSGGFNVVSGMLYVNGGDACLGSPAINNLQFGGAHSFGMLAGYTDFTGTSDYSPISASRTITLNGEGGWIWGHCYQNEPGAYDFMDIDSAITGTGALFEKGDTWTRLLNNGLGAAADTYSGGTVVLGNMYVDTNRSLGTGNVTVETGGILTLSSRANVASGAKVLINKGPVPVQYSGVLNASGTAWGWTTGDGSGYLPTIDPNSTGVLCLNAAENVGEGSPLVTALEAGIAGDGTNGQLWIGANAWSGYYGNSLAPGQPVTPGGNPTYRFSSAGIAAEQNLNIANGVLVGNTDVLINDGGINLDGANTFTGTLTIENTLHMNSGWAWGEYGGGGVTGTEVGVWANAQTTAGASPIGSATGNVVMSGGFLGITGVNGGVAMAKNDLSYTGMDILEIRGSYWDGSVNQPAQTTLSLTTLTRVNNGGLIIAPGSGLGLGVGGTEHLLAANAATMVDSNGVVAPYIVAAQGFGTGDFVTYDATAGFTTYAKYVAMPVGGAGTEVVGTSGATLAGDTNIWNLKTSGAIGGSGTLTLSGGGLILTGDSTFSPNLKAGDGTKELVIFNNANEGPGGSASTFNGTIAAGGLTLFGAGNIRMTADNTATLVGNIIVNGGTIEYSNDNQFGAATNKIILNGGTLWTSYGYNAPIYHNIEIGPAGGCLQDSYWGGVDVESVISDLDPAHPGLVTFGGNTNYIGVAATNTGGTVFSWGSTWLTNSGQPGPGPIIIEAGGHVSVFRSTVPDMSTSAVTILSNGGQMGTLGLAIAGAKIGSLSGSGDVVFGDWWSGQNDMTLYVGYDNTSTNFYGNMYASDGRNGALDKEGTGTLTLWGNADLPSTVVINGGTLQVNGYMGTGSLPGTAANNGSWYTASSAVTVNSGGTLSGQGTVQKNITVNTGGSLTGSLDIVGNVTVSGGLANMTNAVINGGLTLYSGSATMNNGVITGGLTVYSGAYSGASTITGNLSVYGGTFGGTHTINANSGAPWTGGPAGLQVAGGVFDGNNTITGSVYTDRDENWMGYAGTIQGTGSISGNVYVWSGMYNGTHAIAGNVDVEDQWYWDFGSPVNSDFAGKTTIGGNVTLGTNNGSTGTVTFTGGHTIAGSLTVVPGNTQPVTISPHNSVTGSAGTLTVGAGMTLDHGTTLNFNLGQVGTVGGGINDLIAITGDLSLDGTLNVTALTNFGPGVYTLFTYTGALTEPNGNLTLGTMPAGGYTYSFTAGTLHSGLVTTYEINLSVVTPWQLGDTNEDGAVNSLDIDAIYKHFGAAATSQWKVATDGLPVGQQDVTYELHAIFHTNYADANLDRKTDFVDFQVLLDHWQASGPSIGWAQGDFDGSGTVDFLDFQKLLDYWNPGGWNFAPAQAPEPASLTLILLGGLSLLRRRRKNVGSGE